MPTQQIIIRKVILSLSEEIFVLFVTNNIYFCVIDRLPLYKHLLPYNTGCQKRTKRKFNKLVTNICPIQFRNSWQSE